MANLGGRPPKWPDGRADANVLGALRTRGAKAEGGAMGAKGAQEIADVTEASEGATTAFGTHPVAGIL